MQLVQLATDPAHEPQGRVQLTQTVEDTLVVVVVEGQPS